MTLSFFPPENPSAMAFESLIPGSIRESPFGISQSEKEKALLAILEQLTSFHLQNCLPFRRIVELVFPQCLSKDWKPGSLEDLPFIPVGLFKSHTLKSVPDSEVFKTLTSSGTTGQSVSHIFLDQRTAQYQSQALATIMQEILGPQRLPMLIVDTPSLIKDRKTFSARGAGVLGMMTFGRSHCYALNDDMSLNEKAVFQFLDSYAKQPFLIFGFTFMVWKCLFQSIKNMGLDLSEGILVHSGGWKKLQEEAVSNEVFKKEFLRTSGLKRIHNFYGMVEQIGSVFLEGQDGLLHPPRFADVIIRNPLNFKICKEGETGVIQVISCLPGSYPGHSILTEDLGVIHSSDSNNSPWLGKAFSVLGRVPKSELRGCSDVHAYQKNS